MALRISSPVFNERRRTGGRIRRPVLGLLVLLLAGCVSRGPVLAPELSGTDSSRPVELSRTPFFPQTKYYCGPAALATVLTRAGVDTGPQELAPQVYLPGKRGSLQIELVAATRRHQRLPYQIDPDLGALMAELRAGRPVLVFQNLGIKLIPVWHYAVVVGYDPVEDAVILRSGKTRRRVMAAGDFMETWDRTGRWGIVVLNPGEMPADPEPSRYLSAVAAMEAATEPAIQLQWLRPARERWPGHALVRFALGNALYADGRPRAAAAAYRAALDRDPHLHAARNNLAHLLAEQGCLDRALSEIDRAVSEAKDAGQELKNTLGRTRNEIRDRMEAGVQAPAMCPLAEG